MDCEAASERLPWLLSGGLESSEAEEVRAHLAGCPRCREEMDETRRAAAVFGAHLPSSAILDMAWGRSLEPGLAEVARAHIDSCAACREELGLAEESRRLEPASPEGPVLVKGRSPLWRKAVVPAALAAGLFLGFWGGALRRGRVTESPESLGRMAALEAEVARLRALVSVRESAAPKAVLPRLNLPVFEILPRLVQRGPADEANEVAVPAGATEIALLLGTDAPNGAQAALTIADDAGRPVWRGEGLVAGPPGGYVVVVPVELLPDGRYVLTIQPRTGPPVAYNVRVRRARA